MNDILASHPVAALMVAVSVVSPLFALVVAFAQRSLDWLFQALIGLVFVSHQATGDSTVAIQEYFQKRSRFFSAGRRSLWTHFYVHVRPEGAERHIFHRAMDHSNAVMFYRGWPILHVSRENEHGNLPARYFHLRWSVNWERLLRDIQSGLGPTKESGVRYRVVRYTGGRVGKMAFSDNGGYANPPTSSPHPEKTWQPLGYAREEIGPPNPPDPFRHLALGDEADKVIRNAKFWLKHREWYREREMPWRWGCLLKGPPGTGKTSLVRGVAQHLDLPVVVADLSAIDNVDLAYGLRQQIDGAAPCALLLEDVDNVFHGRENIAKDSGLTFDALLNFLDGVEGLDGVITFVTTNRPELLDAALTRPGRLDLHVELPGLDAAGRLRVATLVLQDKEEAESLAADERPGESPAEFKERCCRRARELLWAA